METLPIETIENITQHLAPKDLARCCEVSVEWRQIFNEDRFWKHHCDSTLEEHLRKTPSVVQPVVGTSEIRDSTLIPISQCRMAFLREKHLQNNWKNKNHRKEKVFKLDNEYLTDFLTNNHIVRWCFDRIEIWDVSSVPATMIAKTDFSIILPEFPNRSNCVTVEADLLVCVGETFVQVFHVDTVSKLISLKLKIGIDEVDINPNLRAFNAALSLNCVYENIKRFIIRGNKLMHINKNGSKFRVFDLITGTQLKEEACPASGSRNEPGKFVEMISSENSNDIIVVVSVSEFEFTNTLEQFIFMGMNPNQRSLFPPDKETYHYFIYSPTKLLFLPFTTKSEAPNYDCAIIGDFFALRNLQTLVVYNYHTSDIRLRVPGFYCSKLSVFKDCFIYKDEETDTLTLFYPSDKHEVKVSPCPHHERYSYSITNNKYITCLGYENDEIISVWESSGRSLKKCDIIVGDWKINDGDIDFEEWKINQAFTKAMDSYNQDNYISVYHYW